MQTMSSCSLFCEEKGSVLPLNEFAIQSIPFENEQELLFLNQNNDEKYTYNTFMLCSNCNTGTNYLGRSTLYFYK